MDKFGHGWMQIKKPRMARMTRRNIKDLATDGRNFTQMTLLR